MQSWRWLSYTDQRASVSDAIPTATFAELSSRLAGDEPQPDDFANSVEIQNRVGTSVEALAGGVYRVTKIAGTTAYDSDAVSLAYFPGDFVLRVRRVTNNVRQVYGVTTDPATNSSYTSIDYSLVFDFDRLWYVYENGGFVSGPHADAAIAGAYLWFWRVGTALGYGVAPTLAEAQAAPLRTRTTSANLYFDCSLNEPGSVGEVVFYGDGAVPPAIIGTLARTLAAATGASAAALAIAGTVGRTLSPVTSTSAGALPIAGSASRTLAPATMTATGTGVADEITGTLSRTLAAASSSSAGKLAIAGASSRTLSPATGTGAARLAIAGALTRTLAAATGASVARLAIQGSASRTLSAATGASAARLVIAAGLDRTLAPATVAALGSFDPITGDLVRLLEPAATVAAARLAIAGGLSHALAPAMGSSDAALQVQGILGANLAPATVNAAAWIERLGALAGFLAPATLRSIMTVPAPNRTTTAPGRDRTGTQESRVSRVGADRPRLARTSSGIARARVGAYSPRPR